jgi:hypothetical protein
MDMRFGTWNVRRQYNSGSLTTAARKLTRHKLDLASAQKVGWDKRGILKAEDYTFFC